MNIFDKIKYLRLYCKTLDLNKAELYEKYNIKIDSIYRMYTIYTVSQEDYNIYGENTTGIQNPAISDILEKKTKSGKLTTGDDFVLSSLNKYLYTIDQFLISKGLHELYGITTKKKIDKFNYKVIVEYRFINTLFWANLSLTILASSVMAIIISIMMIIFKSFI